MKLHLFPNLINMRLIFLFLGWPYFSSDVGAQCMYSPVIAKVYFQDECGDKFMQNLVGVEFPVYGNNGTFYFTSPLTDHVIFSSTEESKINLLRIYPNPAFDFVNIEWPMSEEADILIYSQLGQLITTTKLEPQSLSTIDITHLLPGYYLVRAITSTNQIYISKLIKQ